MITTNHLAIKKYVINKAKRTYVKAHVTIPKKVINGMANALYKEFQELAESEQSNLLFSDELLLVLTQKHVERMEREFEIINFEGEEE